MPILPAITLTLTLHHKPRGPHVRPPTACTYTLTTDILCIICVRTVILMFILGSIPFASTHLPCDSERARIAFARSRIRISIYRERATIRED